MTYQSWILVLMLGLFRPTQFRPEPLQYPEALTPSEKRVLETEMKIDSRIRIYTVASDRLHKSIQDSMQKQGFHKLSEQFSAWTRLLSASLEDIDENVPRKKKSKALIRYEIQLRKAILEVQDLKLKAPQEHQAVFESWLVRAGKVRKKFVDILFQR